MKRGFCSAFLILSVGAVAAASGPITYLSGDRPVSVLEVFSSEGCSSCPPAETWISDLKRSPRLWKEIVPVVFHVDYWDTLGWRDRFDSKKYSLRQRTYGSMWGTGSVYTPGFVLNGAEWKGWYEGVSPPPPSEKKVGNLVVTVLDDGSFIVVFDPADSRAADWSVNVAILGMNLSSDVTAGENRGTTLKHDFVVLGLRTQRLESEAGRFRTTLRVPADVPGAPAPEAMAAWVTNKNDVPVQAVGGLLHVR